MTDINTELEHKISIPRNDLVTSDQEHTGFEKVGTVLICDQASTSPNGITSGINEKYFDGQLIRLPRNDDPDSLRTEEFEDLSGVKGSVLYITNIRGRIVGNNPHRELITTWTKKNNKYSVLNNQFPPVDTDLRDTVIDFETVPITIGIQVGGYDPGQVDLEDGQGFIKFYKSGQPGEDDEVVLTVKGETIEEKVKWYMPAKGPTNSNQVLGLDRVEGNEAYLKWVNQAVIPIDPNPSDNCIPNWIETEIQTNTCVTKSSYGVSDITVERRKVKILVCGEIGPATCITNPSMENCCNTEDPIYDCISFSSCSHKSYPNVLCANIVTQAGNEQVEIEYDPIAIPGTSTVICDYRGTTGQGKTIYLAMGGQHIQDTSNTTPLSILCYIDTEEFRLVNPAEDERVGCSPLFLKFQSRNSNASITSLSITECQDISLDCPDLPPDDIDPPLVTICHGCTQLTEHYTYSMSGITGEFAEKGNGTFTLKATQPCLYLEEQPQYYFPNQISFVVVENDYYSGYVPLGTYLVSLNIIAPSSYNEEMKYRSAEYIAYRNPGETCCKNYTLTFLRIVEFDYSDPANPKLNSYLNRGSLPATVTIFAKPCGGGGNNGGCSNIDCSNCSGRTPKRFVVTIAGLSSCSSLNGTYNYDQSALNPCKFVRTGATVGSAYDEITLSGATATLTISNGVSNYVIFSGSYTSCTGLSLAFTGGGGTCATDTAGTATATSDCDEGGGGGGGGGSVSVPCCPSDNLPTDLVATFTGTYASFGTATLTWNGLRWEFNGTLSSGTCGTITKLILTCNSPGPPEWLLAITGTDIDTVTPISGALGSTFEDCTVPQIKFDSTSTSGACAGTFSVIITE